MAYPLLQKRLMILATIRIRHYLLTSPYTTIDYNSPHLGAGDFMRPQERHNEKTRPLMITPGDFSKGNKINFMTSFSQRTTDQVSPYLSRFSVLILGVTIDVLPRLDFTGADALEIVSYYRRNNRKSRLSRENKARLRYEVPRTRAGSSLLPLLIMTFPR